VKSPRSRRLLYTFLALLFLGLVLAAGGCSKERRPESTRYLSDAEDAIAQGDIRAAIVCLEKEIEVNPKNPTAYLRLALIYEHLHRDRAKAEHYYQLYFETETNEAKRKRVEGWQERLDETPLVVTPTPGGAAEGETEIVTSLRQELEGAQRRVKALEKSNEEFAAKVIELGEIRNELEAANDEIEQLTGRRDALKNQVKASAGKTASLQDDIDELKAESKAAQEAANKRVAGLEATIKSLQEDKKKLATRIEELEAERTRSGRRSLSRKLDETRRELEAAQDQNAQYADRIEQLETRIAQLEAQLGVSGTTGQGAVVHEVQEGETLRTISQEYYGTKDRYLDIYEANRDVLTNPDEIKAGQKLVIPREGSR
jgi:nucleoid-associated protein YgaU